MEDALHAVRGGMSVKKAVTVFNIPRTTLRRRLASGVVNKPVSLGRFRPVFNHTFECELVMHAVDMQQRFYGINLLEFRRLVYELADRNGLQHPEAQQQDHPSTVNADISAEPQRKKRTKQRKQPMTPVAQPESQTPRSCTRTCVSS